MGSYIMHLGVANNIKTKYNLSDKYLYGSILPDIKKEIESDRKTTHFIESILIDGKEKNLPNINTAIAKLKNSIDFEVYLGYISHLIEDYIWFDKFIPRYAEKNEENKVIYLKDGSIHDAMEFRKDIYTDYLNLGKLIVKECNVDLAKIISKIPKYIPVGWQEIFLNNVQVNDNKYVGVLISKESIVEYIEEATNQVGQFIMNSIKEKEYEFS